jgi:4-hydroxybenzoate polyprenyltransferase/phosphoserine phosphatase
MNSSLNPAIFPLVVDLDGTLTPTDTLWESIVRLVKQHPHMLLFLPFWLLLGRAGFKARVADHLNWSGHGVPIHEGLLGYLREQKDAGRRIILCTAANERIARTVATQVGVFDDVIASDARNNLKGARKRDAIRERIGPDFVYAGDSHADLPIWNVARASIVVGGSARFRRRVGAHAAAERNFDAQGGTPGLRVWLKALRVHQWLKNLLVFVPLLTSFSLGDVHRGGLALLAFVSFSLAASATYLVNDLWDLDSDRAHPRKRFRPLAAGAVTIRQALAAAGLLLVTAFAIAAATAPRFALLLLGYVVATSAYSWLLKRVVVADVLTLACLYTIRVLAGAVAIGVDVSSWLLAFSGFLFFGLALVKRCAELVSLEEQARTSASGRDYRVSDLRVLWPMGVGASLCAVVVFGLFIHSPETLVRYATPKLIWIAMLGLLYWLTRLWIKTSRGEMHDDPIIFAMRDWNSRITIAFIALAALVAHFVHLDL